MKLFRIIPRYLFLGIALLAFKVNAAELIPEGQGKDNYVVNHSSNVIVLDPDGKLAAVITPPHTPEGVATDFGKIVDYRGG